MKNTILIIEDNADNMALIEEILKDAGFYTVSMGRAEDGIERLYKGGVDLILMDISLPDMDGLEATRLIRAGNMLNRIPIIGLSAHAMTQDKNAALAAGCDDYHTKPIDDEMLLQTMTRLLV